MKNLLAEIILILSFQLFTIQCFAKKQFAFVTLMPLNSHMGNEGLSINPGIEFKKPMGKLILGGGFDYSVWNTTAELVKDFSTFSLPTSWNYFGEVSIIISKTTEDFSIPIYSYTYSNPRQVNRKSSEYLGGGAWRETRTTGTEYDVTSHDTGERTKEHHTKMQALHFGVSGGVRVRDFSKKFNKLNTTLPLLKPNGQETSLDYSYGGLYGTALQHRFYGGYEFFRDISIEGMDAPIFVIWTIDLTYLLSEKMGENLYDLSDPYLITDQTYQTLQPTTFGVQSEVNLRIGAMYTKLGVGFEPGTGGFHTQLGVGFGFNL